jgi:hypothetical protein
LIEDGDRLGVVTDRQLGFFRSKDLEPLDELPFDAERGGLPVRAGLHGGLAAVIFVRPIEVPGVARLGMRCIAVPR